MRMFLEEKNHYSRFKIFFQQELTNINITKVCVNFKMNYLGKKSNLSNLLHVFELRCDVYKEKKHCFYSNLKYTYNTVLKIP